MAVMLLAACIMAAAPATAPADAPALTEDQKIESLIKTVDELKDATFIRNGSTYDCHAAAKHMRDKWKYYKDEIHNAGDFIDKAASKSSVSGRPYMIRFKDGHEVESGAFLREELRKLNG